MQADEEKRSQMKEGGVDGGWINSFSVISQSGRGTKVSTTLIASSLSLLLILPDLCPSFCLIPVSHLCNISHFIYFWFSCATQKVVFNFLLNHAIVHGVNPTLQMVYEGISVNPTLVSGAESALILWLAW